MNKGIDFAALIGRKADSIQSLGRAPSTTSRRRQLNRRRIISSESEEPYILSRTRDNARTGASVRREASQIHQDRLPSDPIPLPEERPSDRIVALDDLVADRGQQTEEPTAASNRKPRGFEDVKTEPLTHDMMKNTMFLMTVHGSPSGPVPVPFTECGTLHSLFPTLIEERGIADDEARKIDHLTTIFDWLGGKYGGKTRGIRRHKAQDWLYFCNSLHRAHEIDADRFEEGKCEVVVQLHIK